VKEEEEGWPRLGSLPLSVSLSLSLTLSQRCLGEGRRGVGEEQKKGNRGRGGEIEDKGTDLTTRAGRAGWRSKRNRLLSL
jgi:hypothetical protein